MHIHKTGELIRAAVLLGARCGNGLEPRALGAAGPLRQVRGPGVPGRGRRAGREADTATLGKTAGKDARQNKPTYVSVLGVSRARAFATELRDRGAGALEAFGGDAGRLRELIDFIVLRSH